MNECMDKCLAVVVVAVAWVKRVFFVGKFVEIEIVHMTRDIRSLINGTACYTHSHNAYSLDGINMLMMLAYLYFVSTISIANGINREH